MVDAVLPNILAVIVVLGCFPEGNAGASGRTRTFDPRLRRPIAYEFQAEKKPETQASTSASTKLIVPAIALSTVQGFDVWSTYRARANGNGIEGNPIMDVGTGSQIAIKAGVTATAIWLARKVEHRHPRIATGLLYSLAGVIGGVAIHNESIVRAR